MDKLDLKDDVLRRANGFYTYFAADIAYHRNKFETRGFDKVINVWGADHHGHVARLQAALDGLGLDGSDRLVIVLMQLVNLLQDGKPVRMSKRTGKAIALHDLLDEISVDAARYFFNYRVPPPARWTSTWTWRSGRTAKTRCTMSSTPTPASARWRPIWPRRGRRRARHERRWTPPCSAPRRNRRWSRIWPSIRRRSGWPPGTTTPAASTVTSPRWREISTGSTMPAASRGKSRRCSGARLKLADCVRVVLANGLGLLGVTAPEKM